MIDFKTAQVRRHQQNLERYCRLLATELTNLQRQYLHKRIAEEYAQLKRLEKAAFGQPHGRMIHVSSRWRVRLGSRR